MRTTYTTKAKTALIPFPLTTGCLGFVAVALVVVPLAPVFGQTAPGITSEPKDLVVDAGSTATFTVTATGTAPLSYQWRFNDTNLAGRTGSSLAVYNVQSTNVGNYTVVVTNPSGPPVTSRIAHLSLPTVHRLDGITPNPDHTFSLNLAGIVPSVYSAYYDIYPLEASTDITNWSPLATLLHPNASPDALSYLDSEATNLDRRFYKTPANLFITPFPKPSGPYPVGTVSRLMTDPSRTNRYFSGNSSFMVTVWYPAEVRAGMLPEAYVENNADLFSYFIPPVPLQTRNPAIVARFVSHALPGLLLANAETSYPVVINPGNFTRRGNTDKAVELASHGYVVVAVDHATWCGASVFPNGQVVYGNSDCYDTQACFKPTLDNAMKDIRFVLDRLNTSDTLFAGRLDLERLGIFGFSMTCVPAAEFCRIDARCKAVVLLDAAGTLDLSPELTQIGLQKPFLSMNCSIAVGPPSAGILGRNPRIQGSPEFLSVTLALFAKATNDAYWFQIRDAGHQSFHDKGSLISDPSLAGNPTPASRAHSQTIRACMVSFFDKYLKNKDNHLLDNPAAVYPNVINFQSK